MEAIRTGRASLARSLLVPLLRCAVSTDFPLTIALLSDGMICVLPVREIFRRKCSWCASASSSLSRMNEARSSLLKLTQHTEGTRQAQRRRNEQRRRKAWKQQAAYETTAQSTRVKRHRTRAAHGAGLAVRGTRSSIPRTLSSLCCVCVPDMMSGCPNVSLCIWNATSAHAPPMIARIG